MSSRLAKIKGRAQNYVRDRIADVGITHFSGPKRHELGESDVAVIILGRDSAFYLDEIFAHHRRLGASHFVYIDNDSSDGSCEIASQQANTIVARSTLPYREYQIRFRRFARQKFVVGGWCLMVDTDELISFDEELFPDLPSLARYANFHGYTAFVGQMLDFFPSGPILAPASAPYNEEIARHVYFDIANISRFDYHDASIAFSWFMQSNSISNAAIKFHFGGVRNKVFGENCCLTKHPLVKNDPSVNHFIHPHVSGGVRCADFDILVRHYKFTDGFDRRERERIARKALTTNEAELRMSKLANSPELSLKSETARKFEGVAQLQDLGFLTTTAGYKSRRAA